jgi:hypothetical protein
MQNENTLFKEINATKYLNNNVFTQIDINQAF